MARAKGKEGARTGSTLGVQSPIDLTGFPSNAPGVKTAANN